MINHDAHPDTLFENAVSMHRQGQLGPAESLYRQVLDQVPNDVEALCNLGLIVSEKGRYSQSIELLQKAITIEPRRPLLYVNLGSVLHKISCYDEAEQAYLHCLELDPDYLEAYKRLSLLYSELGKLDKAQESLDQAIQRHQDVSLYSLKAMNFMAAGKFDEARLCYRRVLEEQPNNATALRMLVQLKKYRQVDDDVEKMIALLGSPQTSVGDRINLCFGLGKVFEEIGDYDTGFEYFRQANQLKRGSLQYDASHFDLIVRKSIETFNEAFFRKNQDQGSDDDTPIFIVGMPRSGTTLVEQILSRHPQVFAAGELEDLKNVLFYSSAAIDLAQYPDAAGKLDAIKIRGLADIYLDKLRRHSDKPHVTDKMPRNFIYLGMIAVMFPRAKIIHCVRDPVATCLSCYQQIFSAGQLFSYDLVELGKFYLGYRELMRHWHEVLPGRIYDIEYEQLIQNQQIESRRLLDACGLKWDERCLDFSRSERSVITSSVQQVRKQIYNDSLKRWLPYRKHLQPLLEVLGIE
jgi:tetratricopeptide (TPR) repeat protein